MPYTFDAHKYRTASSTQTHWGTQVIAELNLQGHEQILDLGCGDGRLSALLAEQVPQGSVLGIDTCPNMIGLAQESIDLPNLKFLCMDIRDLDFTDRFDLVYSNAALHWVHDHQALLQAVYQSLHDRGRIRASFAGDRNCLNLQTVLNEVLAECQFAEAFEDFTWPWYKPTEIEYRSIVAGIPFSTAQVWIQPGDKTYANAAELSAWIDQPCLVPFLGHLPDDLGPSFRQEVTQRMLARTKQPDGTHLEIFNRLHLDAIK